MLVLVSQGESAFFNRFAKDKTNHRRNQHSDVLVGKTSGEEKEDNAFCLDKNILWPIRTHQNMMFHQSRHHRGEVMVKTKSHLLGLLRDLSSACRVITNSKEREKTLIRMTPAIN